MENVGRHFFIVIFHTKAHGRNLPFAESKLAEQKPDSDRRKEAGGGSPQKGQSDTIKKLTCYTLVRVK